MTATSTRKSIFNVIPFGDTTESELRMTAALNDVSVSEAYAANQEPIEEIASPMDDETNPAGLVPGVSKRYWVPIGAMAVAIQPMASAAYQVATAGKLSDIRKALQRLLNEIKRNAAKITPEAWAEMEAERIRKYLREKEKSGKVPDPKMIVPKPYDPKIYLESAYWRPVNQTIQWLQDPVRNTPPFTIFTEGSSKLPFFQWSTVPGVTCPGAGRCWSSKAGSIKMDKNGDPYRDITAAQFYGYSKSWHLFTQYDSKHSGNWPDNYVLNLSNGTMWETLGGALYTNMMNKMLKLKCVRGRFIAINKVYRRDANGNVIMREVKRGNKMVMEPIESTMPKLSEKLAKDEADPRSHPSVATEWRQHMQDLIWKAKEEGIKDAFPCPGKCYACLGAKIGSESWQAVVGAGGYGKHACGEIDRKKPIIIAVH
ncbi:MAG: hypothetical protein EBU84_02150 [Actinobacteria bacterium]|nr:hypothetical protein [Actinomycetota bacterium]